MAVAGARPSRSVDRVSESRSAVRPAPRGPAFRLPAGQRRPSPVKLGAGFRRSATRRREGETMNERLREFVLGISTDLERARQFSADPTAELDQAGLSPEEREIVLRRDPDALREAIGLAPYDPMSLEGFFEKPAPPAETPGK